MSKLKRTVEKIRLIRRSNLYHSNFLSCLFAPITGVKRTIFNYGIWLNGVPFKIYDHIP